MRILSNPSAVVVLISSGAAIAQYANLPQNLSTKMEMHGSATNLNALQEISSPNLDQFAADIPTSELSKVAQTPIHEAAGVTRSAKDAKFIGRHPPL